MAKLSDIEGVGKKFAAKLKKSGVGSTNSLLKMGATVKGRKEIAAKSGCTTKQVLGWVNRVDLWRIKGVGEEYSDLLERSGVDTVPELSRRNAANLTKKMAEVNAKKKLVRQLPSEKQVTSWVAQAKKLKKVIKY